MTAPPDVQFLLGVLFLIGVVLLAVNADLPWNWFKDADAPPPPKAAKGEWWTQDRQTRKEMRAIFGEKHVIDLALYRQANERRPR